MPKKCMPVREILCTAKGAIDFTKFYPPLGIGGQGRAKTAEEALRAAMVTINEIVEYAKTKQDSGLLELISKPVEVETFNTRETSIPFGL